MKKYLKGITWNHPRGYESLQAVSDAYMQRHKEVEISWDIRSLQAFGDYPVTFLAKTYDLIMLDHPHIGSAVENGILLALDQWIEPDYLRDQQVNSVGKSYESYHLNHHQWALAVDAAAQVSAYRPDIMERENRDIPRKWTEVLDLAKQMQGTAWIGFPLCPTDVYCSFLSVCANSKGDDVFDPDRGPDHTAAIEAMDMLRELSDYIYPQSLDMNPIQMLDCMAVTDEIAYVPLLFGYSNYARPSRPGHSVIRFTDIPSATGIPSGALLGGVGLAVSSRCAEKELAVDFVQFTASAEIQKGIYYHNAGQPGYLGAWTDATINASCNQFFADTLDTLRHSYLRPRYEGYNEFQEKAGLLLNAGLKERDTPKEIVAKMEQLFRRLKKEVAEDGGNAAGRVARH